MPDRPNGCSGYTLAMNPGVETLPAAAGGPYETIGVRPIAGALGAEVSGVDLSRPLELKTVAEIRRAFLEHLVIFLHGQDLQLPQYMAFARALGTPVEYPFVKGLPNFPHVIEVKKLEHEKVNFGGIWHSDTTYLDAPPMASMLLAREVPPYGGDTLFANQYLAYETLSEGMKRLIAGLKGVSASAKADVSKTREDRIKTDGKSEARKDFAAEHPVVRTHPETGRKALYVNVAHTARFAGMTEEESAPVLGYLFRYQVRPEFTCRFSWKPGSIAVWDNRCAQHNPVNDYHGHRRVMHRITLAGDVPR
jgi:taurine dioxygenase